VPRRLRPWETDTLPQRNRRGWRVRRVDLHGYDVLTALEVARQAASDAYDNGYQGLELLHGAADVVAPVEGGEGRGGIKWELRRMLAGGQFKAYVDRHELMEGMMRLHLRPNPRPRREEWSEPPAPRR
jgi:hypothetical protein